MAKNPYRVALGLGVIKNFASDTQFQTYMGTAPQIGDIYYNSTKNGYRYYCADGWQDLSPRPSRALINYYDNTFVATPSGSQSVDGSMTVSGDLVLLAAHATTPGIYQADAGSWILIGTLTNTDGTPVSGDSVWVSQGATYANTSWVFDGTQWIKLGIDPALNLGSTLRWDGLGWVENSTVRTDSFQIYGPDDTVADANPANSLNVNAPNKTAGTGDGGNLVLTGGSSVGGNNGSVLLSGYKIRLDAQNAADPMTGQVTDVYYNTAENRFKYYDGTNWKLFGTGGVGIYIVDYSHVSNSMPTVDPFLPDGTAVVVGDKVLFSNLTPLSDRGVYEVVDITLGVITWQRVIYGQSPIGESVDGDFIWIKSGANRGDNLWVCTDTATANWTDYENLLTANFANRTLSNLSSPLSINQDLRPNADNTLTIGTASRRYSDLFAVTAKDASSVESVNFDLRQLKSGGNSKLTWSGTGITYTSDAGADTIQEEVLAATTLLDNQSNTLLFSFAMATWGSWEIDYQVTASDSSYRQRGKLTVVHNGTIVSITDTGAIAGTSDTVFSAAVNAGNIEILYSTSNLSITRTMKGRITKVPA